MACGGIAGLSLLAVLLSLAPALADGVIDVARCNGAAQIGDFDTAIALCSRALNSGDLTNEKVAVALFNRGNAYAGKGENDRAIQNLDQAIRMKPDSPFAFSSRGSAYGGKGEVDRAIQDFDQAIRLQPDYADAYFNRGDAHRRKGEHDQAIRDFDKALQLKPELGDRVAWDRGVSLFSLQRFDEAAQSFAQRAKADPSDAYAPIWQYLAQTCGHRDGAAALEAAAAGLDLGKWPGPVIRFYLGRVSQAEVLKEAANPDPKNDRRCEADFYLGERGLDQGRVADARLLFQHARDVCPKGLIESQAAEAELGRM
jgi:lipoprotein NlpI